jgi:hypothetical protein
LICWGASTVQNYQSGIKTNWNRAHTHSWWSKTWGNMCAKRPPRLCRQDEHRAVRAVNWGCHRCTHRTNDAQPNLWVYF